MDIREQIVEVRGPLRLDLALRYLASSPATIAEVVDGDGYARAFATDAGAALLRVEPAAAGARVTVAGVGVDDRALAAGLAIATRVFGLDRDLAGLDDLTSRDPRLGGYVSRYRGLRIVTIPDPFEALVWAILGQQINITFAAKIKRALLETYGESIEVGGRVYRAFPRPERLRHVTAEELRPLQISRQKAWYIAALAEAVCAGAIDLETLRDLPDEPAIVELTRLRGIGRWTAEYLLLRGFGRADAIPAADMGLRAIVGRLYSLGRNATEDEVRRLAEAWAPWRGYAAFYLWFALQQREG